MIGGRCVAPACAVAFFLSLGVPGAKADLFQFSLWSPNQAISGFTGPYAGVSVSTAGFNSSVATITFTAITNGTNQYLFGDGSSVDVNSNGAATASGFTGTKYFASGSPVYSSGGSGNVDGFGTFSNTVNTTDGFSDTSTSISFTLTKSNGTWADAAAVLSANSSGSLAAAHIYVCTIVGTACVAPGPGGSGGTALATGFAAGAGSGGTITNFGEVPEPTSIFLLGTVTFALATLLRKKTRQHTK